MQKLYTKSLFDLLYLIFRKVENKIEYQLFIEVQFNKFCEANS
jgi:hypothetical protein